MQHHCLERRVISFRRKTKHLEHTAINTLQYYLTAPSDGCGKIYSKSTLTMPLGALLRRRLPTPRLAASHSQPFIGDPITRTLQVLAIGVRFVQGVRCHRTELYLSLSLPISFSIPRHPRHSCAMLSHARVHSRTQAQYAHGTMICLPVLAQAV